MLNAVSISTPAFQMLASASSPAFSAVLVLPKSHPSSGLFSRVQLLWPSRLGFLWLLPSINPNIRREICISRRKNSGCYNGKQLRIIYQIVYNQTHTTHSCSLKSAGSGGRSLLFHQHCHRCRQLIQDHAGAGAPHAEARALPVRGHQHCVHTYKMGLMLLPSSLGGQEPGRAGSLLPCEVPPKRKAQHSRTGDKHCSGCLRKNSSAESCEDVNCFSSVPWGLPLQRPLSPMNS